MLCDRDTKPSLYNLGLVVIAGKLEIESVGDADITQGVGRETGIMGVCMGGEAESLELILDNELQLADRLHLIVKLFVPDDVLLLSSVELFTESLAHEPVRLRSNLGILACW